MHYNFKSLEFDKIRQRLAKFALSEDGKKLCETLVPYAKIEDAEKALAETDAAAVLYIKYQIPQFEDLRDVVNSCTRAQSGSTLSIRELMDIGLVLRVARNLHDFLEEKPEAKVFNEYCERLMPNKYFEEKIQSAFISEDEVADTASPALLEIRRKQMQAKNKIRSSLEGIIHSQSHQKQLQDSIVTIRNGRYVIPVKAEYRNEFGGLVHDVSSSGATLFIEPVQVVQANNELSVLASKEQQEIERILSEFSVEAGAFAENIIENYKVSLFFDFTFAKARFAYDLKASRPKLNQDGIVKLRAARHPLIDKEKVVPIDVSLGSEYNALIITGPNTGGKTVTLKTVGLLCLMAKSGLFIPTKDGASVAFFDNVFADIGDEQSIEQSLSTFSSHMKNIIGILEKADNNSLVLLDELGSGTDPAEGAALAISIIEKLLNIGVRLVCTTHYAELKLYALHTPNVENASCEFDVATLRPTYRLIVGIPGKSNAFAIASKLGMTDEIIESAKENLKSETVNVEAVLADLEIKRKSIELDAERAAELKYDAERRLKNIENEIAARWADSERDIKKQKEKAADLIERTRREAESMMRQIEDLRKAKDKEEFRKSLKQAQAKVDETIASLENEAELNKKPEKKPLSRALVKGDDVRIYSLGVEAVVLELPDSKGMVYVQAGAMKTKVKLTDLELIKKKRTEYESVATVKTNRATRSVKSELDIRGMTAFEAESLIEDYLSDCVTSGLNTVSIIHGKGTGALRSAVQMQLKNHPLVAEYRLGLYGEGENGVTIITLKK